MRDGSRRTTLPAVLACGAILGACRPSQEVDGSSTTPCTQDTDCAGNLRCTGGACAPASCTVDDACRDGEWCVEQACRSLASLQCAANQHAVLELSPVNGVDFGTLPLDHTGSQTVVITNGGTCLLVLQDAAATGTDFTCPDCAISPVQRVVVPGRSLAVHVTFTPAIPGLHQGDLQARAEDPAVPVVHCVLLGYGEDVPHLLVEPAVLDFGYVPPGSDATKTVRLSNRGEGVATVTVQEASLRGPAFPGFSFTPAISTPLVLSPVQSGVDCLTTHSCLDLEVRFTPPEAAGFNNDLVFTVDPVPPQPSAVVTLKGFSTWPPVLQLSENTVDFGSQALGSSVDYRIVTLTNGGQTDMGVRVTLDPASNTDFWVELPPLVELPVPAGDHTKVRIHYAPAELGLVSGTVRITTSDPTVYDAAFGPGTQVITLRGTGTASTTADQVKVDMRFDNGLRGWPGNDFRRVNLHLHSSAEEDCTAPEYQTGPTGAVLGLLSNPCSEWSSGPVPSWWASAPTQEPQRILLTPAQGIHYVVRASYEQDCALLPASVVADQLGIPGDGMEDSVGSGMVDLGALDPFIRESCWDRQPTTASVTVLANGERMQECSASLRAAGDIRDVARIQRVNGVFQVQCL